MRRIAVFNRISIFVLIILMGGVSAYRVAQWYYCLPPLTSYLMPGACVTLSEATYENVGRAEFHATNTNCDTLAKEEFVEVYAYKSDRSSILPRWLRKRTVVFVYDPGADGDSLPRIEAMGENRIRISVPEVSSILWRQAGWNGNNLEYDIGRVDYPIAAAPIAH